MDEPCEISVLMSVFNTDPRWLEESIDSVLSQTFEDFEFIIILDNPTDNSTEIVKKKALSDKRIRVIENESNKGLTFNLNHGIKVARGKYIARIDSDDVCFPERLEKQRDFMEKHPDAAVVGSYVDTIDEESTHFTNMNNCSNNQLLNEVKMLFCNAGVVHSTAFIRKAFLHDHGINYDLSCKKAQDYCLWADISLAHGHIYCIREPLVVYRMHSGQITKQFGEDQKRCFANVIKKQLKTLFLNDYSEDIASMHLNLIFCDSNVSLGEYKAFIASCIKANLKNKRYHHRFLKIELKYRYFKMLLKRKRTFSTIFEMIKTILYLPLLTYFLAIKSSDSSYARIISKRSSCEVINEDKVSK